MFLVQYWTQKTVIVLLSTDVLGGYLARVYRWRQGDNQKVNFLAISFSAYKKDQYLYHELYNLESSMPESCSLFSKIVSEMGSSVDRLSPGPFSSSLLVNVSHSKVGYC